MADKPTKQPKSLDVIDGLGLTMGVKEDGTKTRRLKDVKSALAIYTRLKDADRQSALQRARIDGMFDGAAPYDQSKLNASGQGQKTNLNFGEAQRLLDISLSAYVDLYSSLEKFVNVKGTVGEDAQRHEWEDIVSSELTQLLKAWPEFHSNYLRLCTTFIKHGVGVAYFDSPEGWQFKVGSFEDILIPRQTPSSEEAIDVSVIRRSYHIHELANFIKNPEAAAKVGWNVDEVKRVMVKNVTTNGRGSFSTGNLNSDYESLQAEIKNNDLLVGVENPTVSVLHFLVRETDGTLSHYSCVESSPSKFLYEKPSRYKSAEEAYVMFTYGVGSNGTYHSIRGLGQRVFSHVQTSNRLRCQMIDGAMISSAVMLQPESSRALEELDMTFYGSYAVLSPNVNIIEKAIPNLSNAVQPALQDMQNQLAMNTDTQSPYGPSQSSPYRNKDQVISDMDVSTQLSGAALNLFYASWGRLLREVVKRVIKSPKDQRTKDFCDRCYDRGVPKEFLDNLDLARTTAVRAIGDGSRANRLASLRELNAISGSFDEVGRANLTRDIVATRVGADIADRYAPQMDVPRETVDNKIAIMETATLNQGQPMPVLSSELHGTHLGIHLESFGQLLEALNTGQADPMQAMPVLQAFYQHIAEHTQFASGEPALEGLVARAKQSLQYGEEMINNTAKAMEKIQRDEAQAQQQMTEEEAAMMQQQGEQPQQEDPKIAAAQVQMQIMQQKAELEMSIKQQKHEQDQAIRDAEAAMKFQEDARG
jgi:hypothetical protein